MSELKPCPFCGGDAEFERMGDSRQSCIVACTDCGCRHESSDEYSNNGHSWNSRHVPEGWQLVPTAAIRHAAAVLRSDAGPMTCEATAEGLERLLAAPSPGQEE